MARPPKPEQNAAVVQAALSGGWADLKRGLRRAYLFTFALPAVPAFLLGALLWTFGGAEASARAPLAWPGWALLALSVTLQGLAFVGALVTYRRVQSTLPPRQALFTMAFQLTSVPLVAWLLASASLGEGWGTWTTLGLFVLATLTLWLCWRFCWQRAQATL